MIDVKFYEVFEEEKRALQKYLPSKIKAEFTPKTIQETKERSSPAGLVSIRTQSYLPTGWARNVRGIITRSSGYDHLRDVRKTSSQIKCGYLPDYCSRSVAEQAMTLMLALLRRLPEQTAHFSRFDRDGLTGNECFEKKLLVAGVGRIGYAIVQLGAGMGMNVKGLDIDRRHKKVKYVSASDGVAWADIIVCSLPLTPKTRGMLGYKTLSARRQPLLSLINVSRGEVTPLTDCHRLLNERRVKALGLDVFEDEGILADQMRAGGSGKNSQLKIIRELEKRPNVILTPHNAFNTAEALDRKARQSAESVVQFLKSASFPFPVPKS